MDLSSTIYTHLGQVNDPEIPVLSLHDMGILRGVNVLPETDERHAQALESFRTSHPDAPNEHADHVYEIVISPTYVGCPAMDRMSQDIEEAMFVRQLPFAITQQLQPSWTTEWISEEGRKKMEAYGIAPPVSGSADKRALFAE
ncbi:MAG TPA: hypothetical protein DCR47_06035, partial [Cryomorphaceae bacterium]|nr:hypothetical protein [Cryomorphaceae bacterium]